MGIKIDKVLPGNIVNHEHSVDELQATGTPSSTTYLRGDGSWSTPAGSGGVDWGAIGGTLSDQTDLQTALNAKANDSAVVKLTGDQTVAGVKTFSSNISAANLSGTNTGDQDLSGKVNIAGDSMTGELQITKTARQMRLRHDASNYADFTVNSAGRMIFENTAKIAVFEDSEFQISRPTGTNLGAFKVFQNGNAAQSFEFSSQGNLNWGPGTSGIDTGMFRKGAALLQIENQLWLGGFGVEDIRLGFADGTIFNLQNKNMDFRVDGVTDNLIFGDASADRVGIGTDTPNNKLDVVGTVQADGLRLDLTPTAETPTMTHTITVSISGTNYKIPLVAA